MWEEFTKVQVLSCRVPTFMNTEIERKKGGMYKLWRKRNKLITEGDTLYGTVNRNRQKEKKKEYINYHEKENLINEPDNVLRGADAKAKTFPAKDKPTWAYFHCGPVFQLGTMERYYHIIYVPYFQILFTSLYIYWASDICF